MHTFLSLLLLTMLTPRRKRAEAEKASPRLLRNPSINSGKCPPNAKFPTIPKTVITIMGLVQTPFKK